MAATQFLKRLSSLVDLSEADEAEVRSLPWSVVNVRRGRDVLSVGHKPGFAYVVQTGWAARYSLRKNGSRRITGVMLPGDFCGIHAVAGAAMDHAILAIADCEIGRIELPEIEKAAQSFPTINKALWRAKLAEEATLRAWLLNSREAIQAIARLICELHARLSFIGAISDGHFTVPLNQEHIGDALGLTSVHVSRMLKELRAAGLADYQRQELLIPDMDALRAACGFDPAYLYLR